MFALIRKVFFITFIVVSTLIVERFCHKHTDGFSVSKIRHSFAKYLKEGLPQFSSSADLKQVHSILTQPLHYIGRGGQCYAFSTQDEKYVVKLLKYNNNYPRFWFSLIPFPFGLEAFRQEKIAKKQKKLRGEYTSYHIAAQELSKETGILYFHLQQGDLDNVKLHIKDKLGITHALKADDYQFYIQKRGSPFYPGLQAMIKEGRSEAAKQAISELVSFLYKRCQKKITDGDDGIHRNFAFQDDHPFQIDIGQFSYEPSLCSKKDYEQDLIFFTKDFRNWLERTSPPLAQHLMDSIHSLTPLEESLRAPSN